MFKCPLDSTFPSLDEFVSKERKTTYPPRAHALSRARTAALHAASMRGPRAACYDVAPRRDALQHAAACCNADIATCCNGSQRVATFCNVLRRDALRCSVLQRVAAHSVTHTHTP